MLAKHLEEEKSIPFNELIKFQKDVENDFRKKFGVRKDGKCTAQIKRAFKVYLNSKSERYDRFKSGTSVFKIDEYFQINYPHIREYIVNRNDIWQISMNEEFDVMSKGLVQELYENDIVSFTCHDAIYVKKSVQVPNIKEMFYQKLDLVSDRTDKMMEL